MPKKFDASGIDFYTFTWMTMSNFVSPILLIIGMLLKPYKISTLIPIYCYTIQGYFILVSGYLVDNTGWLYVYAFVSMLIIFSVIEYVKHLSKKYINSLFNQEKERLKQRIK